MTLSLGGLHTYTYIHLGPTGTLAQHDLSRVHGPSMFAQPSLRIDRGCGPCTVVSDKDDDCTISIESETEIQLDPLSVLPDRSRYLSCPSLETCFPPIAGETQSSEERKNLSRNTRKKMFCIRCRCIRTHGTKERLCTFGIKINL